MLGLGYAAPYLRLWRGEAARCVAATPAQVGAARWPSAAANLSCTAEEDALPFPDLCSTACCWCMGWRRPRTRAAMLREVWRVLKDDGRLLVVAPNRRGMWAHVESTPFGQGQPYSPGQIGRLLAGVACFVSSGATTALYLPPTRCALVLRSARLWERAGRRLVPQLAGVTITEAVKDVYAAVPVSGGRQRRRRLSEAAS